MTGHRHVSVHNIHHNSGSAAELALGLIISAARMILPADRALRKGDWSWRYSQERRILIGGSRVLILGCGHIGRRVGRVCSVLGARVTGIRRHPDSGTADGVDRMMPPGSLEELLPDTDILVIALPLTEATRGIMGPVQLGLLNDRSILVNIGRGELVDEEALHRSLAEGSIGAAGIDVWYSYPGSVEERTATFPSRYDFASLDNVVMTPHMGGAFGSGELELLRAEHIAESLNQLASLGTMPFRVDLEAGY
jgi:phosphoglycerate dehydrogenase-like enzyme